jgi:predicted TIM-barrel fold metal-dependent hydrolase
MGGLLGGGRRIRAAGPLREVLNEVALVDHHAHGIVATPQTLDEFRGLFSESEDPRQWPHVATGLTYLRAIATLAALFGCEPTEEAVFAHRRATPPDEYAAVLLRSTGTAWLLIDDGFPAPGEGEDFRRMGELAGCRSAPVMRIERVGEQGIARGLGLEDLREHVRAEVAAARGHGFAGLKTVAAYRSGLDVSDRPDPGVAANALAKAHATRPVRLEDRALLERLLHDALEANAATGAPLPVQVHTGFGDADLFLPRADPTLLGPLVERFRDTPFVLLHCYPFVRGAGWMAHVYGNVYLDVSLTIPHVWRAREMVREALELAPVSKLLYASDAARTPELYHLAAAGWRAALAEVLGEALDDRAAAERAGRAILRDNALALYGLAAD